MSDQKEHGLLHYQSKFINRGKMTKGMPKHRTTGNAISMSHSRPTSNIKSYRAFELGPIKEIAHHHIIDNKCMVTKFMSRKTMLPQSVTYEEYPKLNRQIQSNINTITKIIKPYIVNLSSISPKLYVGNLECLNDPINIQNKKIVKIINVSNVILPRCSKGLIHCCACDNNDHIVNIEFKDTRNISYKFFVSIVQQTNQIIDDTIGNVLIVCNKGVNRSTSLAMAYGITNGMTYDDANDYVSEQKRKMDAKWNHMTNCTIRTLLKALNSNANKN